MKYSPTTILLAKILKQNLKIPFSTQQLAFIVSEVANDLINQSDTKVIIKNTVKAAFQTGTPDQKAEIYFLMRTVTELRPVFG